MKSNIKRKSEIFSGVIPPENSAELRDLKTILEERNKENPHFDKITKEYWDKVHLSLEAQYLSNIQLNTENTLRHFLLEFNNRAWSYGLRSMPIMFNIMEPYFNYIKPQIYFELLEEENYLLSFFEFVDFITSKEFDENPKYVFDNISDDIIYNFTLTNFENITFQGENGTENIITGISLIKRENEVTVTMIVGKELINGQSINNIELNLEVENPNKKKIVEEFQKEYEKEALKYIFVDDDEKFIKTLIVARIDIDTMTIDSRYVAEENSLTFRVNTDEVDGFLDSSGNFIPEYENVFNNSLEILKDFDALYEILKFALYIPYYFNENENLIIEEIHETELGVKYKSPFSRRKFKNTFGDKKYKKELFLIEKNENLQPDRIILRDDLFNIEKSGYWKKLEIDNVGMDKKGNSIHGKTWVTTNTSWFEAKSKEVIIEKSKNTFEGKNSGFIYIIRNPLQSENTFKIGLTRKNVNDRVSQLSNTSTPDKFYKMNEWNVKDCVKAEKEIHTILENYRIDLRREFFDIEYSKAAEVITEVVNRINKEEQE